MKHKLFYILLFGFIPLLNAQNTTTEIERAFNKGMSFHYSNKDSAYYYYEKTIQLANKQNDLNTLLRSYIYLINANGNNYDLNNYGINIKREEEILFNDKRLDTFSNLKYYKNYLLFDKGNYNYKLKQYNISKKYFKDLLAKINTKPKDQQTKYDLEMVSSIYGFLGLNYRHTGKYDLATSIFNKDLLLLNRNKDSFADWEYRSHNTKKLLSQVYEVKKEYIKANALLVKSLTYYKTKANEPRFKNNILATFILLAKNNIKQKKFQQAIKILNENALFYKEENSFTKQIELLYGDAYLGLKQYKTAEKYYRASLDKSLVFRNNEKHIDIAKVHRKIANLFIQQGKFDKGLQQYQLALIQLENGFNNMAIISNPTPKKVTSKTTLIRILKAKLNALYTAYKSTKNSSFLTNAHQTSKVLVTTLDLLRPEFESKIDKQFLITETYPSLQKSVQVAYELFQNTKDNTYIDDAFFFIEKSKSILLLEAQRNAEAIKFGGVPKKTLIKEQHFRAKISHLEEIIFKNTTKNQAVIDTLFAVKNRYQNYILKIEHDFPEYYNLKYKNNIATSKQTQQSLEKNQAVLNYLVVNDELYLVLIDKNNTHFLKLNFDDKIKNLIKSSYHDFSNLNIKDQSIYKKSASIYHAILKTALSKTKATNLIISADGLTNYIPFDALNTAYPKIDFLLKTHSISYANSVTLFLEQQKIRFKGKPKLLIFAPDFSGKTILNHDRNDLGKLLYNQEEATNIASFFNGKIYKGTNASIANFNTEKEHYNLLHFATHASANDDFPDYSYLAFSDNNKDNLLYVKDIYNYKIPANLVTLSACETGIGKLQNGEGMLSLARAFNYAGAPSIITTLWKINGESTSEIMEYFYKNLYNGLSKKEALRQAKLTYLELNDDPLLKHPYYWSGIILTGNTTPITSKSMLIWILLSAFIAIIIMALFKKYKS